MVQTSPRPQELMIIEEKSSSSGDIAVEQKKKKEIINKPLPFHKLLSYADAMDWALMALGTLGSIVHGMAQPIGYLLLGRALNAFGNNIDDTHAMVKALYQVRTICAITTNAMLAHTDVHTRHLYI